MAKAVQELGLHEHLCVIYETDGARLAAALSFLESGSEKGQQCIYIGSKNVAADIRADPRIADGGLATVSQQDVFLRQGHYDPRSMIGFFTEATHQAAANRFSGLCIVGEMSWVLGSAVGAGVVECESALESFLRVHDASMLCQYDRRLFSPNVLIDVLRTHSRIISDGYVCNNPYFIPPDEYRKSNPAAEELERMLDSIRSYEQAAEATKTSEEHWWSIFENSSIGIVKSEVDGKIAVANQAYQAMVGLGNEELKNMTVLDLTPDEDRGRHAELIAALRDGSRKEVQIRHRQSQVNGASIWVRSTISLVPGTLRSPTFLMTIVEDVTEQKRAEDQLRRNDAYLAEAQRLTHVGSWAMDPANMEITFWSREHYLIFGFDPDKGEVPYRQATERIHPEDLPILRAVLRRAIVAREDFALDLRVVLPDGSTKHIRSIGHPIENQAGELVEFIGTVMDVTERKRTEAQLNASLSDLRALAFRLQSAREEERKKVAREIHDELGQALTAIKIDLASFLHALPVTEPQQEKAGSILKLLDETIYSVRRIATELRPGILDDLGLVAAVEWAAEEFEARTGTKCRLDLPRDEIHIDPERAIAIFRIFQETLTNVARHAAATEVTVRLKQNGDIVLEVRDNGRGLPEESSGRRSFGVLGMRERALLLRGELTISGPRGKGTVVRVRIPEQLGVEPDEPR